MRISRIEYPILKRKMWNEYLWNKIFGAVSSSFLLLIFLFIFIFFHIDIEKESIRPLIAGFGNGSIYFLIAGFGVATARSLFKGYRLIKTGKEKEEDVIKLPDDMKWTYSVNYPIILSFIYILGSYFLREQPSYVYRAILFGLGFYVDVVFEKNISLIT